MSGLACVALLLVALVLVDRQERRSMRELRREAERVAANLRSRERGEASWERRA